MLAEQGLLTGELAHVSREELVEDIVEQTKLALSVAIKAAGKKTDKRRTVHTSGDHSHSPIRWIRYR